jgi:hypothetical protein
MKTITNIILILILSVSVLPGCKKKKDQKGKKQASFVINGTIKGIDEGLISMKLYKNPFAQHPLDTSFKEQTVKIQNGKFNFKGNLKEVSRYQLVIKEPILTNNEITFYAENSLMTISAHRDSIYSAKIEGSKTQQDYLKYESLRRNIFDEVGKVCPTGIAADIKNKEDEKKYRALWREIGDLGEKFVRKNPKSYYSAIIIESESKGKSGEDLETLRNLLDPTLDNYSVVKWLEAKIEDLKGGDSSLADIIPTAKNVNYKVDKDYKGKIITDAVYLAMFKDDNLCSVSAEGLVRIINSDGKEMQNFNSELKGAATSVATDENDNIYVFDCERKVKVTKIRGKEFHMATPLGATCLVYNKLGVLQRSFPLQDIKVASGARVMKGKIVVSDYKNNRVGIFDAGNGTKLSAIENMRSCCGILDFSINKDQQILVANLGAFRVQMYDLEGKSLLKFGKRGKKLEDFHGCCNPVSIASLASGAIATVEKDPTRVKIFSKDGASQIQGIEELVKGCAYIPMIVDSKDNIYLASKDKGLVKCIAI